MQAFNIRVYGLLFNEQQQLLVSDEWIRGAKITKFPGGGLELGEGTRDALAREFIEEMNLKVEVLDHFYTTDFYQQSAFNPDHQIISIYYKVKALEPITVSLKSIPFDFDEQALVQYRQTQETEVFRFIQVDAALPHSLSLPIDKLVASMLL